MKPARIRDFIRDYDDWLYATTAYDNSERVGCLLRYIPDNSGDRIDKRGVCYRKVGFEEAYNIIREKKPDWSDIVHRIPLKEIKEYLKPDERLDSVSVENPKVKELVKVLDIPKGTFGITGSLLCGLGSESSDIDGVVYGNYFKNAQDKLKTAVSNGKISPLDEDLWRTVYKKRNPDTSFDEFVLHEKRKWNRGQIDGTYFDLLYSRSYDAITGLAMIKGDVLGELTIEAKVTDDKYAFDSPAVYEVDHPKVSRVLSFTHTYTGQAFKGERLEARGVLERHNNELWLVVGTTREAKGEWIRSLTLLEDFA